MDDEDQIEGMSLRGACTYPEITPFNGLMIHYALTWETLTARGVIQHTAYFHIGDLGLYRIGPVVAVMHPFEKAYTLH